MNTKGILVFIAAALLVLFVRKNQFRALPLPQNISGYWTGPCNNPGKGHASTWRVYELNFGKDIEIYYVLFADPYCKNPLALNLALGKLTLSPSKIPGAYNADVIYSKFMWRYLTNEGVRNANAGRLYGHSDWALGKYVDVTGTPELKAGSIQYDLLQLQHNSLLWGNSDSGKGLSTSERPTELDPPEAAYKRITEIPAYLRPSSK